MQTAKIFADLSTAQRLKVGAIVVKENRIISIGYNGTPAGWDNVCEDKIWDTGSGGWLSPEEIQEQYPYEEFHPDSQRMVRFKLKTKPEVIHAERNALDKLAKGSEGGQGAYMFITHAPCLECAKSIFGAGISNVYYDQQYKTTEGVDFLHRCGITVNKG